LVIFRKYRPNQNQTRKALLEYAYVHVRHLALAAPDVSDIPTLAKLTEYVDVTLFKRILHKSYHVSNHLLHKWREPVHNEYHDGQLYNYCLWTVLLRNHTIVFEFNEIVIQVCCWLMTFTLRSCRLGKYNCHWNVQSIKFSRQNEVNRLNSWR